MHECVCVRESAYASTCVCHMGYSCQCDIYVCASLSVNSLGYSVCLSPANSLHIDQVGMQNLREEEGWWEGERGRKGGGGVGCGSI